MQSHPHWEISAATEPKDKSSEKKLPLTQTKVERADELEKLLNKSFQEASTGKMKSFPQELLNQIQPGSSKTAKGITLDDAELILADENAPNGVRHIDVSFTIHWSLPVQTSENRISTSREEDFYEQAIAEAQAAYPNADPNTSEGAQIGRSIRSLLDGTATIEGPALGKALAVEGAMLTANKIIGNPPPSSVDVALGVYGQYQEFKTSSGGGEAQSSATVDQAQQNSANSSGASSETHVSWILDEGSFNGSAAGQNSENTGKAGEGKIVISGKLPVADTDNSPVRDIMALLKDAQMNSAWRQ